MCFSAVTFRQFVTNLLWSMQTKPRLASLFLELTNMIARYDDCMQTCDIPFTKRTSYTTRSTKKFKAGTSLPRRSRHVCTRCSLSNELARCILHAYTTINKYGMIRLPMILCVYILLVALCYSHTFVYCQICVTTNISDQIFILVYTRYHYSCPIYYDF